MNKQNRIFTKVNRFPPLSYLVLIFTFMLCHASLAQRATSENGFDYRAAKAKAVKRYPLHKVGDQVELVTRVGTIKGRFHGHGVNSIIINGTIVVPLADLSEDDRARFDSELNESKRDAFIEQQLQNFLKSNNADKNSRTSTPDTKTQLPPEKSPLQAKKQTRLKIDTANISRFEDQLDSAEKDFYSALSKKTTDPFCKEYENNLSRLVFTGRRIQDEIIKDGNKVNMNFPRHAIILTKVWEDFKRRKINPYRLHLHRAIMNTSKRQFLDLKQDPDADYLLWLEQRTTYNIATCQLDRNNKGCVAFVSEFFSAVKELRTGLDMIMSVSENVD